MEKRVLLAIVLSFLVLVLYQALFVKKPTPSTTTPEATQKVDKVPSQQAPQKTESPSVPALPQEEVSHPIIESLEKEITVDTSLYRAVWSNKGAVLKSWTLKQYQDENQENLELVSLHSQEINKYPFALNTDDATFNNQVNQALYKFSNPKIELKQGQKSERKDIYLSRWKIFI